MKNRGSHAVYNKKKASSYDNQRARLAPLKDALYLCTRMILSELPVDAQVLCIGVGTGSELIYLAQEFPPMAFHRCRAYASHVEHLPPALPKNLVSRHVVPSMKVILIHSLTQLLSMQPLVF